MGQLQTASFFELSIENEKQTSSRYIKYLSSSVCIIAGVVGIEPTSKVLETSILPMNYTPIYDVFQLTKAILTYYRPQCKKNSINNFILFFTILHLSVLQ